MRAAFLAAAFVAAPLPAWAADGPLDLAGAVTVDVASVVAGDGDSKLRALTNIDLTADADLASLVGWQGARAHVYVLDNRGARPNDAASTLQGVNNIEVPKKGLRLFEAWIEQDIGDKAALLVGLFDLNSEFYANEAAGLLIAPAFGIGSELAATGPNGPSIFPSSALAARLRVSLGDGPGFVRLAAVNALASTLGDHGGIDFGFHDGLLLIGEAGVGEGRLRGSIGAWRYTHKRDELFQTDALGNPLRKTSQGAYVVVEGDLLPEDGDRQLTAFLRAGLSDPHTTPFSGGFQTGLLLSPAPALAFALSTLESPTHKPILLARNPRRLPLPVQLHGEGLAALGIDPARLLLVETPDDCALLQAGLDAARCAGLAAVVLETWGALPRYDLTASRRLVLAAERSGVPVILLRGKAQPRASAAHSRWTVRSAPSARPAPALAAPALAASLPGPPACEVELSRRRGAPAGMRWRLEWDEANGGFHAQRIDAATLSGAVVPVASLRAVAQGGAGVLRFPAGTGDAQRQCVAAGGGGRGGEPAGAGAGHDPGRRAGALSAAGELAA